MKRTVILIVCLTMAITGSLAQSVAELFKGDGLLSSLFVNPLGIRDLPDNADAVSVENLIKTSGNEFQRMSLGPFGDVFRISPAGLLIGETPIATLAVYANNSSVMLLYLSESSESYRSMYDTLRNALAPYAKDMEISDSSQTDNTIYMLSDTYGIAIGANQTTQTSMAMLIDLKNLRHSLLSPETP